MLPLAGKEGLVYGSNDGGRQVFNDSPELSQLVKECAAKLNLKGHFIGLKEQRAFIYGPTDIEGHIGKDKRFYLLDFVLVFQTVIHLPDQFLKNMNNIAKDFSSSRSQKPKEKLFVYAITI